MLSIRTAEPRDVGVLRTMIHEMAEYERLPVVWKTSTFVLSFGRKELATPCWLASQASPWSRTALA